MLLSPFRGFISGREGSKQVLLTVSADYCMLVNEWAWLRSQVWLFSLKVHLGLFLESELRQIGALQACVC